MISRLVAAPNQSRRRRFRTEPVILREFAGESPLLNPGSCETSFWNESDSTLDCCSITKLDYNRAYTPSNNYVRGTTICPWFAEQLEAVDSRVMLVRSLSIFMDRRHSSTDPICDLSLLRSMFRCKRKLLFSSLVRFEEQTGGMGYITDK